MAKARAITQRRKAVRNIRKITQTMQLIATARFQKCLQRATASQPYTNAISDMIATVASAGTVEHPLLKENESADDSILLVITSNRGLCGSYNAAILRSAFQFRRSELEAGRKPAVEMVGKKGVNYARFVKVPLDLTTTDVEDKIAYARVAAMADRYMELYTEGALARVDVAYTRFVSASQQVATVEQLLPIERPKADEDDSQRPDFEFSPEPAELLGRLIPETVRIRLYQFFNDAIVSEQVSRMVAMKAATDSAGDMIKYLSQQYNRARQTQITMELLDIVGGAEAIAS
jgi:F-type H+-transporting ATPase subunit gamma